MKISKDKNATYKLGTRKCKIIEVYGESVGFGRIKFLDNEEETDILFRVLSKCKKE